MYKESENNDKDDQENRDIERIKEKIKWERRD